MPPPILEYEAEMALVISKHASNVKTEYAYDHIFGYLNFFDVSARGVPAFYQMKSRDRFARMGPWLVTADEVADPQDLRLWTEINGVRRQDGNTAKMIFPVPTIISYVSRFMSLNPGDVVSTGSPHGAAAGFDPPAWLQTGDRVEMGIEALGTQSHMVVPWKE